MRFPGGIITEDSLALITGHHLGSMLPQLVPLQGFFVAALEVTLFAHKNILRVDRLEMFVEIFLTELQSTLRTSFLLVNIPPVRVQQFFSFEKIII